MWKVDSGHLVNKKQNIQIFYTLHVLRMSNRHFNAKTITEKHKIC